jgi:hypothetical protein
MPTIALSDQFGFSVDAQLAPNASLLKYLQQIPNLRFDSLDLSKIAGLTLDDPAVQNLSTGITFQQPVSLGQGAGSPALSIGAGVGGGFEIRTTPEILPDGDDDAGQAPPDSCYFAVSLSATASADLTATSGMLTFGAMPSTKVEIASCSRFPLKSGVTLLDAIEQTVAAFVIPATSADLETLAAGGSAKAAVSGKLTLSGDVNLLAVTNPLASATLPSPLPAPTVSAGGSVTAGVSWAIETEYEVVARRLESGAIRIGWYHKQGTEVTVNAAASEGISAGFGSTDLFSAIIGVISANPKVDLQELTAAGLPPGQIAAIQYAVHAAVARKLEIAVSAALTLTDSTAAAFLYDIVPEQLDDSSRAAIDKAIAGDLTALHSAALPGISCVRSIWSQVQKRGVEFDVNLLGILNARSVASLALEGKVVYEPASGALILSDTATAQRIQSVQVNFGADTDKLRHVLAESFLLTAAYHGSLQAVGGATLRCSHCFFDLEASAGPSDVAPKLRTGVALGLLTADQAALPAGISDFGHTLCIATADYDDKLVSAMFLDSNDAPLPEETYENAGRAAIAFLVAQGDEDDVRLQPATDDGLWASMKQAGQPGFAEIFPGLAAPLLGAITADYTTIEWWADAMHSTAQQLAAQRDWFKRNPAASPDDPELQKLRQALAAHLKDVAANTREEFGEPWGLIAMNRLAAAAGGARILVSSPVLTRDQRRELAAGAGA